MGRLYMKWILFLCLSFFNPLAMGIRRLPQPISQKILLRSLEATGDQNRVKLAEKKLIDLMHIHPQTELDLINMLTTSVRETAKNIMLKRQKISLKGFQKLVYLLKDTDEKTREVAEELLISLSQYKKESKKIQSLLIEVFLQGSLPTQQSIFRILSSENFLTLPYVKYVVFVLQSIIIERDSSTKTRELATQLLLNYIRRDVWDLPHYVKEEVLIWVRRRGVFNLSSPNPDKKTCPSAFSF